MKWKIRSQIVATPKFKQIEEGDNYVEKTYRNCGVRSHGAHSFPTLDVWDSGPEAVSSGPLSIAKSPNLQKTLDFLAGSQYSRRDDRWFNCLHLGVLLRLQSAS